MTTTSTVPIDSHPIHQHHPVSLDDSIDDPLPDETILKTGWLMKKGRRGVLTIFPPEFQ
jgi:hypothetical protein